MKRVILINETTQSFDGLRYFADKVGRPYFRRTTHKNNKLTTVSLHREVWEYFNYPIPKGMHIHHLDGDWRNNQIKNLVLLDGHAHLSAHMKKPERVRQMREQADRMRPLAIAWHKDPANRQFHVDIAKKSWENKKRVKLSCAHCKTEFTTPFPNQARFCNQNCKMNARRRRLRGLPEDAPKSALSTPQ